MEVSIEPICQELATDQGIGPVVIRPACREAKAIGGLAAAAAAIENELAGRGAVVLRDWGLGAVSDFSKAVSLFSDSLLEYVYRSTPRTQLGGRIFTATEYPAHRHIPLHNENSYARVWPARIFFFSAVVAAEGGQTPIADSRRVLRRIDAGVREKFERLGVRYVRNYTPGVDLPWQEVFQTQDRAAVLTFCEKHEIEAEWNDDGQMLTTRQVCQATSIHRCTGEAVWFNQAHLFHVSALSGDERCALTAALGESRLPRNASYGNGEPIELDVLDHIRDAYSRETLTFDWQRGDLMILDNVLYAHGRRPFRGPRKVVVAMA
jgi:hypothetical protein